MPMSRDFKRSARVKFRFIVDFDQHVHAKGEGRSLKVGRTGIVDARP